MIRYKNAKQIEGIRESCKMLCALYRELIPQVLPGVETMALDQWARLWIKKAGGKPAFLGYGPKKHPFPGALCISINEEVIHGIPSARKIKNGDLVGVDCGINYHGFFSDKSVTVEAGNVSPQARRLNAATRECLQKAIGAVHAGARLHEVGRAVFDHASAAGFGVVRSFCGHGVGMDVHEDPQVSNCPEDGPNPRMREGLVIAIEPMINMGTGDVEILDDYWTVVTADRMLSAHWEHTVALTAEGTEVLTEDPVLDSLLDKTHDSSCLR